MEEVTSRAFDAQERALAIKEVREGECVLGSVGGFCWAMEMDRLFTGRCD